MIREDIDHHSFSSQISPSLRTHSELLRIQSLRFRPRLLELETLYQLQSVLHFGHVTLLTDNCLLAWHGISTPKYKVEGTFREGTFLNLMIALQNWRMNHR